MGCSSKTANESIVYCCTCGGSFIVMSVKQVSFVKKINRFYFNCNELNEKRQNSTENRVQVAKGHLSSAKLIVKTIYGGK